ncbi:hypothetical protein BG015_006016 [Linnemannia schmuckeri]|uniref:Uncharacterized protein n=1 Tax=Linnemannia schmuckeri TaxID=64567 RepID=A0A9P5UVG8_9FUNG|nr:hypothetical protein BG015_006016 [Linnemannia schmuckeri]
MDTNSPIGTTTLLGPQKSLGNHLSTSYTVPQPYQPFKKNQLPTPQEDAPDATQKFIATVMKPYNDDMVAQANLGCMYRQEDGVQRD